MNEALDRIAALLLGYRGQPGSVFLYAHVGIDGDALGSCLSLLLALRKAGVGARFLMDEPVSFRLTFLPCLDRIEPYQDEKLDELAAGQLLAMAVDCTGGARTGRLQALFDKAPLTAVLDHHVNDVAAEPLQYFDTTAAAVGEIAYDLIRLLENHLQMDLMDRDMATLLMTAIISDTGGFVFSNTTARTFHTAASLMVYSINLRQITYHQFDMTSQARLRLMGRLFGCARFEKDGRLAISLAGQHLLEETGASDTDLDGVISYIRNVAGVEAAFLIRELPDGSLRVNIRSGEKFDAADFASCFGGGGHPRAAGFQLSGMTLEEAAGLVSSKAGERL
jgi:bifunctional oligoribonuclease and PAP phosphatase NrnA